MAHSSTYTITQLSTLGGNNLGGQSSAATSINDNGQVAGRAVDSTGVSEAVLWQSGSIYGVPSGLGTIFNGANAINASGQLVGVTYYNKP